MKPGSNSSSSTPVNNNLRNVSPTAPTAMSKTTIETNKSTDTRSKTTGGQSTAKNSVDWKAVGQAALDIVITVGAVALTVATFGTATAIAVAGTALAVTAYDTVTSGLRGETVTAGDVLHNMAFNTTVGAAIPVLYSNPVTASITTYALTGLGATATVSSGVRLADDISKGESGGTIVADVADTALCAFGTYKGIQGCIEIAQGATAQAASESGIGSPKGLIGHKFEDYLTKEIGGDGSFSVGEREYDGGIGNRWWEAKSGQYWDMLESNTNEFAKFKSDMGARMGIAIENGATYELFSNTPIPESIKIWLTKKGIPYTEMLG